MQLYFKKIYLFISSTIILLGIVSASAQADPSKNEIDAYARTNGFLNSNYPYYGIENGCGGNGVKVPDKYRATIKVPSPTWKNPFRMKDKVIFNADFTNACNVHDRCYMTLGKTKEKCDLEFDSDLLYACNHPSIGGIGAILLTGGTTLGACISLVSLYGGAVHVSTQARDSYKKSQKDALAYSGLTNSYIDSYIASRNNAILAPIIVLLME